MTRKQAFESMIKKINGSDHVDAIKEHAKAGYIGGRWDRGAKCYYLLLIDVSVKGNPINISAMIDEDIVWFTLELTSRKNHEYYKVYNAYDFDRAIEEFFEKGDRKEQEQQLRSEIREAFKDFTHKNNLEEALKKAYYREDNVTRCLVVPELEIDSQVFNIKIIQNKSTGFTRSIVRKGNKQDAYYDVPYDKESLIDTITGLLQVEKQISINAPTEDDFYEEFADIIVCSELAAMLYEKLPDFDGHITQQKTVMKWGYTIELCVFMDIIKGEYWFIFCAKVESGPWLSTRDVHYFDHMVEKYIMEVLS